MSCEHELRTGPCELDHGHRGRHSTVAFYCDGCGAMRRGYPHAADEHVALCWYCVKVTGPAEDARRWAEEGQT